MEKKKKQYSQNLTNKQKAFISEYMVDSNGKEAAIRAGYSPRTADSQAAQLLSLPKVAAELQLRQSRVMKKVNISAEWVLEKLVENVERAMQGTPVTDRQGNPTGEWRYNGQVANKALELLGRHLAMFVDKSEVELKGLSVADLISMANRVKVNSEV